MFSSVIDNLGPTQLPTFSGTRIMMMPFEVSDVSSLPTAIAPWRPVVSELIGRCNPGASGVGYITIDEAVVAPGEMHRRPGLHVDGGIDPNGVKRGWGGPPPGVWGAGGMVVAASVLGSVGWAQDFDGEPGQEGDCEHLRDQLNPDCEVPLVANTAFHLAALAVHEVVPSSGPRQFLRISFPNDAPWYEGYTENPLGIKPAGPILPPRHEFMSYR